MERKFYLAVILIVAVGLVVAYLFSSGIFREEEEYNIHYEIDIEPSGTYDYTVYFPIPVGGSSNGGEVKTHILEEIKTVRGDPERTVINTTYGYALKIEADTRITLRYDKKLVDPSTEKWRNYTISSLSMVTSGNEGPIYEVNHSYNVAEDEIEYHRLYYNSTRPDKTTELSCEIYTKDWGPGGSSQLVWGFDAYKMREGWQTVDFAVVSVSADR